MSISAWENLHEPKAFLCHSRPAMYASNHMYVEQVVEEALENAGLSKNDVDWLVLHQANQRILDAAAQRLGFGPDQVVSNLAEYGNTSAASIPLVLDEAVRRGSIKDGSLVGSLSLMTSWAKGLWNFLKFYFPDNVIACGFILEYL